MTGVSYNGYHLQFDIAPNFYVSFDFTCPVRPYMLADGDELPLEFFDLIGEMRLAGDPHDGCGVVKFIPKKLPNAEEVHSLLKDTPFTREDLITIREVVHGSLCGENWTCRQCS